MHADWSISKDELYGPPPAYSVNPPSPIYVIPEAPVEQQRSPPSLSSIVLPTNLLRYLVATAVLHMLIGLTTIVCDLLLVSMNESFPFIGICTGALCIVLGIYLILFMSQAKKSTWSLQRFKLIHIVACLLLIIALILSSINLAASSCYEMYYQFDQCQQSAKKLKIVLVTFFAWTLAQIVLTFALTFLRLR